MNRVLVIAVACALLVLGAGWFLIGRPREPALPAKDATFEPAPTRDASRAEAPSRESSRPVAPPRAAPPVAAAPSDAPAPAPTVGTLHIDSDVPGALVFIDRKSVGRAPVTVENVAPGTHQLNVSAEGFEGIAEPIEVSPGPRDIVVKLREFRLNVSLSVVHKHRIGSCSGQLIGTPQGLRYVTSDKDDAFSAGLTDLDEFEVDYLMKNLRVKPRGGKQYNFTDPEGDADRLFGFHRDVVRARARLAKGDTPAPEP